MVIKKPSQRLFLLHSKSRRPTSNPLVTAFPDPGNGFDQMETFKRDQAARLFSMRKISSHTLAVWGLSILIIRGNPEMWHTLTTRYISHLEIVWTNGSTNGGILDTVMRQGVGFQMFFCHRRVWYGLVVSLWEIWDGPNGRLKLV